MKAKVILNGDFKVSNWSGGKTTQMIIYPEQASYADRDFTFRISSATVDAEQSDFTILPNVERIIMVLEGNLRLCHEGEEVFLSEYMSYRFDGGKSTKSYGRAIDFNLMMRNCTGDAEGVAIGEGKLKIDCNGDFTCIYIDKGEVIAACDGGEHHLPREAMLCVEGEGELELAAKGLPAHAVMCKIRI